MGVSTDAILFYGYCWNDEHTLWKVTETTEDVEDESDWETRYARTQGLAPPSAPSPERTVPQTRENGWSATPKDYSTAEQAIIDQYSAYWDKKRELIKSAPCSVGTHCSASCPMPYVTVQATVTRSHRGYPSKIKIGSLVVDPAWDRVLATFCEEMGIKVGNKKPAWWLVSDWSE